MNNRLYRQRYHAAQEPPISHQRAMPFPSASERIETTLMEGVFDALDGRMNVVVALKLRNRVMLTVSRSLWDREFGTLATSAPNEQEAIQRAVHDALREKTRL